MNDRVYIREAPPPLPLAGWYGLVCGDGEEEVWVGAAYWDGYDWQDNVDHAYVRSVKRFNTEQEAFNWASAQPD